MSATPVAPAELLKGVGVLQLEKRLPLERLTPELIDLLLLLDRTRHPSVDRAVARGLQRVMPADDPAIRTEGPAREELRQMLIGLWSAFDGGNRGYVYASVPITSGRRELRLLRRLRCSREELRTRHKQARYGQIIRPNEADAKAFSARLQEALLKHPNAPWQVLNPAGVTVLDWTQSDYMELWLEVVELFAVAIAVTPGWAYSGGSRQELALALHLGLPVYDSTGRMVPPARLARDDARARQTLIREGMGEDQIALYLPYVDFTPRPYIRRRDRARRLPGTRRSA